MLYEFYGLECPHCQAMRKISDKLIADTGVHIERKEIWHNKENMKLIKECDAKDECGGVPFFYNSENKQWLCGEVTYDELKAWAGVK